MFDLGAILIGWDGDRRAGMALISTLRPEGDSPVLLRGLRKIGTVPSMSAWVASIAAVCLAASGCERAVDANVAAGKSARSSVTTDAPAKAVAT